MGRRVAAGNHDTEGRNKPARLWRDVDHAVFACAAVRFCCATVMLLARACTWFCAAPTAAADEASVWIAWYWEREARKKAVIDV